MSLDYEPASKTLHIYIKQLFLGSGTSVKNNYTGAVLNLANARKRGIVFLLSACKPHVRIKKVLKHSEPFSVEGEELIKGSIQEEQHSTLQTGVRDFGVCKLVQGLRIQREMQGGWG